MNLNPKEGVAAWAEERKEEEVSVLPTQSKSCSLGYRVCGMETLGPDVGDLVLCFRAEPLISFVLPAWFS